MDFESCFTDCCMACKSLSPNFRTSSRIRGQGDCKDSISFQEHQNYWVKGKSIRNKFQGSFGLKEEQQENQFNAYNNCLGRNNKNENFLDKIGHETKCEKKGIDILQNCNTPWNSAYASWTNNKIKESSAFENLKNNENINRDKLVADTISELKEKVEFLLKTFKNYNPKIFNDNYHEKSFGDYLGEVPHLFDIDKRLSIAEKSIQKLTFILEYLLKDSNKKKTSSFNKNPIFSEPFNFEELPITQRINLLKNRNDVLFGFMKDFLQVRSIEELCSMLNLMPRTYESNQTSWNPTFCIYEENQPNSFNQQNVMEILKELRRQVSDENMETPPSFNESYPVRSEKREENTTKCFRNKLEVISEQAELAFFYDNENENSQKFRKNSSEFSKERLTEFKQESLENSGFSEKTAKLLAQEAILKSTLDKVDFDIFSNGDSSEKNLSFNNSPVSLTIETPIDKNNERENETSLDSSRTIYWEPENVKKSKVKSTGKHRLHEEHKKEIKERRNTEPTSSGLPKRSSCIKQRETPAPKNQPLCKVLQQKSHTLLRPTVKPKEIDFHLPEICSPPFEETKKTLKVKNQRPMSTPGFHSKTLQTSGIRPLVPEKNRKKNSEINTVKNINKLILSQKSCARTA